MKVFSTLHIGAFHTHHCEDFLIHEQIGTNRKLIAVLDGCTMGEESVFAAILYGKILRKIAKEKFYHEFIQSEEQSLNQLLKDTVLSLMHATIATKNELGLEVNELLSTLIVGVVDLHYSQAELLTIGDGLIAVDGALYEYEQNDKPDYIGYHLNEEPEVWYDEQEQRLSITSFKDLSICTDGLFTFKNFEDITKQKSEDEIKAFLLFDSEGMEFDNFLDRKVLKLKQEYNHSVTDDLAMIRILKA